jgi:hypothetical protein
VLPQNPTNELWRFDLHRRICASRGGSQGRKRRGSGRTARPASSGKLAIVVIEDSDDAAGGPR